VGERLMAPLAAEPQATVSKNPILALWPRLGSWLSELNPRTFKWSATIAVLALVLLAGPIGDLGGMFSTSSVPDRKPANDAYAYVSFAPEASSVDITRFLRAHRAQIVEGPRANGIYKIRVEGSLPEAEAATVLEDIRRPNDVVRFIGTTSK
jgi:hypothetical protein